MHLAMTVFQFSIGGAIEAAILWLGYTYRSAIPAPNNAEDAGERLAYAIRCLFPMVAVMMINVATISVFRTDPELHNPLAGNEHKIQVYKNLLTNTTEQLLISAVLMLVCASLTTCREMLKIIPLYAVSFVVARVLYSVGYRVSPYNRSVGISINFFISSGLVMYITYVYYSIWNSNPQAANVKTEF